MNPGGLAHSLDSVILLCVCGKTKAIRKGLPLASMPTFASQLHTRLAAPSVHWVPSPVANSRTWFQHLSHCLLIISYFFSLIFLTGCTHISCSHVLLHLSLGKKYLPWSHSSFQLPPYFSPLIYSTVFQKGDLYLSSLLLFCSS